VVRQREFVYEPDGQDDEIFERCEINSVII